MFLDPAIQRFRFKFEINAWMNDVQYLPERHVHCLPALTIFLTPGVADACCMCHRVSDVTHRNVPTVRKRAYCTIVLSLYG
jgi:hypothetical protein